MSYRRYKGQSEVFQYKGVNPKLFLRPLNATKQGYFFLPQSVLGLSDSLEPGELVYLQKVVNRDSRGRGGKVVVEVRSKRTSNVVNVFLEDLIIRGY